MKTALLAVLAVFLGLILVVGLHEFGHFFAARCFGVPIKRVSIGFGKPIWLWVDRHGVEWVWARWPLGGFVLLQQTRYAGSRTAVDNERVCFDKRSLTVRLIILLAGVCTNLMVALLALWLLYFAGGYQRLEPVIKRVIPHSLVAHAGLQAADTIVTLAGRPVHSWTMVSQQLLLHLGEPALAVKVVDATGQVRLHHLDLQTWRIPKTPQAFFVSLGWVADPAASHVHTVAGVSCGQAWQRAWQSLCFMVYFSAYTLKLLLCGDLPFGFLLGPLGLLVLMAQTLSHSVAIFLSFIANLSIVVALGNLLPIPGLDGAAMMFAIIEKVRGKPMSQAFELLLYRLAYIAFCVLLLQFVIHDLNRLLT